MATKAVVTKVWIEDGCIVCDACETTAPDVFEVLEDVCIVRPEALTPDFTKPRSEAISDAAEECPVDVIKFETVSEEVADEVPAAANAGDAMTARRPEPEECYEAWGALQGHITFSLSSPRYYFIPCQCCNGSGRHDSGHLNVQDAYDYACEPCKGTGEFKIEVPK